MLIFYAKFPILLRMTTKNLTIVSGPHGLCSSYFYFHSFLTYWTPFPQISLCSNLVGPPVGSQRQKCFLFWIYMSGNLLLSFSSWLTFLVFSGFCSDVTFSMKAALTILFPIVTCSIYCSAAKHVQLFCDPMDCSPPGSSGHGISQARVLKWVAVSFSRASFWPRDQTCISALAGRFFTTEPYPPHGCSHFPSVHCDFS